MSDIDYKKRCEEYESILGIGDNDIARKAFFAFCRMADLMTKRLNKFNIDSEITKEKSDLIYDRTMSIQSEMPKVIININTLRKELGISNKQIQEAFIDTIADKRY